MQSSLSIVILLLSSLVATSSAALVDRCGDCWCGTDGTCPTDESGIYDEFDTATLDLMETFVMTNSPDFLLLQSADGGDCYPFADTLGAQSYSESTTPQCTFTEELDTSVCALKYEMNITECSGRSYEIMTYDTEELATADGAVVTHTGGCGVCSSVQDFWARMKYKETFQATALTCATSFFFNSDFDALIGCYAALGLSTPCSTLWAHYAATNTIQCASVCISNDGNTPLNLDPPTCELADCLSCAAGFQADFDNLAGRTFQNSGITEAIARACTSFSRVDHDFCVGVESDGTTPAPVTSDAPVATPTTTTDAPAAAPTDSAANTHLCSWRPAFYVLAVISLFVVG